MGGCSCCWGPLLLPALSPEERQRRRQVALQAVQDRMGKQQGISPGTVVKLMGRQQKEELLGKLTEHYAKKRET